MLFVSVCVFLCDVVVAFYFNITSTSQIKLWTDYSRHTVYSHYTYIWGVYFIFIFIFFPLYETNDCSSGIALFDFVLFYHVILLLRVCVWFSERKRDLLIRIRNTCVLLCEWVCVYTSKCNDDDDDDDFSFFMNIVSVRLTLTDTVFF